MHYTCTLLPAFNAVFIEYMRQEIKLFHLSFTAIGFSISPQYKFFLMKHTLMKQAGIDQQTSPVWKHEARLWAKKSKGNSPTTFTLFSGHKRQMHCTIWEVFQVSIFFEVHDTQHEAECFKLLWHQMCFRRGAVNVDECRTDQVLHTFAFNVWQHQSCA